MCEFQGLERVRKMKENVKAKVNQIKDIRYRFIKNLCGDEILKR